jgi:hypothetical protein
MSCMCCENVIIENCQGESNFKKTDYARIFRMKLGNELSDHFLVPRDCYLSQSIVIYYCPYCGKKL